MLEGTTKRKRAKGSHHQPKWTIRLPEEKRRRVLSETQVEEEVKAVEIKEEQRDPTSALKLFLKDDGSSLQKLEKKSRKGKEKEEEKEEEEEEEEEGDSVNLLLRAFDDFSVSAKQKYGLALQDAAADGNIAVVRDILYNQFSQVKSYLGWGLGFAAENGHADVVNLILETAGDQLLPGQIKWALSKAQDNAHHPISNMLQGFIDFQRSRPLSFS